MAKQLELKDSIIDKLDTAFYVEQPNGSQKLIEKIRYNFPHCKGQQCQGLGLIHKRKSGHKTMFLDYWLNVGAKVLNKDKTINWDESKGWKKLKDGTIKWGESKRYVLGNYDKKDFNVRLIEKKISGLRQLYGNPNNLTWDKDIHAGEELKKRGTYAAQLEELKNHTVNQAVESFFKSGCPKINKPSESLNRSTISDVIRYLIGYNERTLLLRVANNEFHNGVISFSEESGINSIEELFKKYPAKEYSKAGAGISLYDSSLGLQNIKDLTEHDARNYIFTVKQPRHSASTKRSIELCMGACS